MNNYNHVLFIWKVFNLSSHLASCSLKNHLEGISILIQSLYDVSEIQASPGNQQSSIFTGHIYFYISEGVSELSNRETLDKISSHTKADRNIYDEPIK